jgi:hypothetical protein
MEPPFLEDAALCQVAERFGLELSRYRGIEVLDEVALGAAGLMRPSPDYPKIRKALDEGRTVPGVRDVGTKYTLQRRPT